MQLKEKIVDDNSVANTSPKHGNNSAIDYGVQYVSGAMRLLNSHYRNYGLPT